MYIINQLKLINPNCTEENNFFNVQGIFFKSQGKVREFYFLKLMVTLFKHLLDTIHRDEKKVIHGENAYR